MQNREELGSHVQMRERRTAGRRRRLPEPERFGGDSGAVLAEAALITPLFFFLLFGILEFGGLFRDYLTLNNATQTGARAGAIYGNDPLADYQILQAVKKASTAMPSSQIVRIVVFHPSSATGAATSGCKSGNPSTGTGSPNYTDACNTYVSANLFSPQGQFSCGSTSPDRFWCPTSRKYAITGPNSPPDYLGVWMRIVHPWVTGLFGSQILIDNSTVVKIEPKALK